MSTPLPPPSAAAKPKKRHARRLFIPLFLIVFLALAFLIAYIRGTWVDTQVRDPATVAAGPVSQLYQTPDGPAVRCAILLPYPIERVWDVVTDYPHYNDFVPYLHDIDAERTDNVVQLKGKADAVISGTWPFGVAVHEDKEASPQHWRAWWDEKPTGSDIVVNRGSWVLTPAGDKQTLLVLSLQAEVQHTPAFILRNFFLHRLKVVVRNVEKRLKSQSP